MEACRRLYPGIQPRDFIARMKQYIVEPNAANPDGVRISPNTLSNRMKRFRDKNGLLPWYGKFKETQAMKAEILKHLSDDQIRQNSTDGFLGLLGNVREDVQQRVKVAKGRGIKRSRKAVSISSDSE